MQREQAGEEKRNGQGFYILLLGSLSELDTQYQIAVRLKYIDSQIEVEIKVKFIRIMLTKLIDRLNEQKE